MNADWKPAVQAALWSVHLHSYFGPGDPLFCDGAFDELEQLQPVSLDEAFHILEAEARREHFSPDGERVAVARLREATQRVTETFGSYGDSSTSGTSYVPPGTTGYPPGTTGYPPGTTGFPPGTTGFPPGTTGYPPGTTGPFTKKGAPDPTQQGQPAEELATTSFALTSTTSALRSSQPALPLKNYTSYSDVPTDVLSQMPTIDSSFRVDPFVTSGFRATRNRFCDITMHCATDFMTIAAGIDVQRPFHEMRNGIDPRNWDYCSAFAIVAARQEDPTEPCPNTDPGRPADAGSSWQDYFCESVGTGVTQIPLAQNRLWVSCTFAADDSKVTTTFTEDNGTGHTFLENWLVYDRGYVVAGESPGEPHWTRIRSVKHLKFAPTWLRLVGVPLAEAWVTDELLVAANCTA